MNERSIEVVIDIFIVIIGIAVERLITKFPLGEDLAFEPADAQPLAEGRSRDHLKYHNGWYSFCYPLSLAIIITLALRFLVGSDFHLRHSYVIKPGDVHQFFWDVCFLLLFGGFIVKAALAKEILWFAGWLTWCSGVTVCWGLYAWPRAEQHLLISWWLKYDSIQFLITLAVTLGCWYCARRKWHKFCNVGLIALSAWYLVFSYFDLIKILSS